MHRNPDVEDAILKSGVHHDKYWNGPGDSIDLSPAFSAVKHIAPASFELHTTRETAEH